MRQGPLVAGSRSSQVSKWSGELSTKYWNRCPFRVESADTARKPGNGPTARFLAPPLPDVPPRPKNAATGRFGLLAAVWPSGCPAVERRGRVKGETGSRSGAQGRSPEHRTGEDFGAKREPLTLNRSGHAPGRGEGKKGRRPVCPTPLTTEGDSFPPEGGRRGETQGEAAQAVGRRGGTLRPPLGATICGKGSRARRAWGNPAGVPRASHA